MKKFISFLIMATVAVTAFSQTGYYYISGKVVDATTKLPMQAASVFAQNTTMGTVTDAEGNFKMALPNGGYDLVITYTGYQTTSKRITSTDADDKNIIIELKQKEKAMEDVVIRSTGEVKDGWEKYGDFFLENFIGKTENSKLCSIKNKEAIHFYFSKKRNRLKILATEPVEIVNEALGYSIKYAVDSFTYEYNSDVSLYTGYPLFDELQSTDTAKLNLWAANRKKAYKGSMLHFMRSLYNKQLKEEGFEIQFLVKTSDKETAVPLLNFYGAINYNKDDSTQTVEILPNQTEVVVIYNKEVPEQNYLNINPDQPEKFQLTVLSFVPKESVIVEQNGYYFEQTDITINQYLGWKKMADMLPFDFKAN
ncbi:carboxypeptidase-like regulatory domain-containing protein [Ferruginibacter sp.]|nr:carboxypeptidase-like regulatory domain-containing protein [Ferruginibacter sp.]